MKKKKKKQTALWIIIVLIFLLLVALSAIVFLYHDYCKIKNDIQQKTNAVERSESSRTQNIVEISDTVLPVGKENHTITKNRVGEISLGDKIEDVISKYSKRFNIIESSIGPDKYDKIYLFKDKGEPRLSVIADTKGLVNTIFAFNVNYESSIGIKPGDNFSELLKLVTKKDMRFGDVLDGVNELGSAEMLNSEGVVYIHYVEEDSERMIADYNYEKNTFKIKKNVPDERIDAIMVSASVW